MSEKICVVFGAGNEFPPDIDFPPGCRVIAADGGYKKLCALGITPDNTVGDLDSLGERPEGDFRLLPHKKDVTDMFEAVQIGIENGCSEFHLYGGTGGRPDHTLANIQLLAMLSQKGMSAYLYGRDHVYTCVTNGSIVLPAQKSGYVSVFSHSDVCMGVTIKGLMYELEDGELKNDFALGVSNEFIGKETVISVKSGTLCIYYEI